MVLDHATAEDAYPYDSAPFPDQPFSDSPDPYESPDVPPPTDQPYLRVVQPNVPPIYIPIRDLPRSPIPFRQWDPRTMSEVLQRNCDRAQEIVGRPVTPDEATAFAFHNAKMARITAYGPFIGAAIAIIPAYLRRAEYRFPGWSPMKKGSPFSPDQFLFLRGRSARAMWQVLRGGAYGAIGGVLGGFFFGFYAMSIRIAGTMTDSRLQDFNRALTALARKRRGDLPARQEEGAGARPGWETYDMARQRRGVQEMSRTRGKVTDDASPTGGAFTEEYLYKAEQPGFISGQEVEREADERVKAIRQRAESSPFTAGRTTDDSASQSSRASREGQAQQGSAWDRLRREAISGQPKASTQGSAVSKTAGVRSSSRGAENAPSDAFDLTEDTQRDRVRSQRAFDASIERKREGRDFGADNDTRGWNR